MAIEVYIQPLIVLKRLINRFRKRKARCQLRLACHMRGRNGEILVSIAVIKIVLFAELTVGAPATVIPHNGIFTGKMIFLFLVRRIIR